MASRTARSMLFCGKRSLNAFRKISAQDSVQSCLKSLHRTSSSGVQVSPALSSVLPTFVKRSSPSFVSHVRRLQDLATKIDTTTNCGLSTDCENSQDISLLEQSSEDDDDQFRKRGEEILNKVKSEAQSAQHTGRIFAIVLVGGSQFKVAINDIIVVNKLKAEVGSKIKLEKVLLVGGECFTLVGQPLISQEAVNVKATIMEHTKSEKIIVFKKKRRKGYKRTQGHRQPITVLRIDKITVQSISM